MNTVYFRRLNVLFRDYGYEYLQDGRLISKGIRGWTSDEILPFRFRSIGEAAHHIYQRVMTDEFYRRWQAAGEVR